ncbi:MAG: ATP-binding protein [Bdellovibrionales bacterium]
MSFFTSFRRRFWKRPFRRLKRISPRGLFGRTILIIVLPTLLALGVATFVFFDRHWHTTTHRLTHAVAGDIATFTELLESSNAQEEQIYDLAFRRLDLKLKIMPYQVLPTLPRHFITPLEDMFVHALRERVPYPTRVDMGYANGYYAIYVLTSSGLYRYVVPERRIYLPTAEVFIGWMIGSSILLSVIALLFMRNQVRPVRRLAAAAEAIGKGQDVPWFKQEGAKEVRQASAALMLMRDRLRRAMTQRTAMLAGVSHDLRTPLTRMKLQLAMMPDTAEARGFKEDIEDMEAMLEGYLAFARGDEAEAPQEISLKKFLEQLVIAAQKENPNVRAVIDVDGKATWRLHAMQRCVTNLINNAMRYGKNVTVTLALRDNIADIFIDDDGPGIPEDRYGDVFKPFLRLDESRNVNTGGVGLGLSIARDIARKHGGDIRLSKSPLGGLRAHLWGPV